MTRARVVTAAMLCLAAVIAPVWYWDGGSLETEATSFVVNYTADRPILQRVFDPHLNDFDAYQARELSYFFDLLDAESLLWLARVAHVVAFVPVSSIVSSILLVAIFLTGIFATMKGIDTAVAALLAAGMVSSFQFVSTMPIFYRSSKPVLAVVVMAFLFHARRVYQDPARRSAGPRSVNRDALVAAALCCIGGLLDRQGSFLTMLAALMLGIHFFTRGELGNLFAAAAAAAVFNESYNLVIGPLLIHAINGYWPDFSYQADLLSSWKLPARPRPFFLSIDLLAENTGVLAGGIRAVGWALFAAFAIAVSRLRHWRDHHWMRAYAAIVFAALVFMYALMIRHHPPIADWVDCRFTYYPLPYVVFVIFGAALWLNGWLPGLSAAQRRIVVIALIAIVLSNIATTNAARARMITVENGSDQWFPAVYEQSVALKASLRSGVADPALKDEHLKFFEFIRGRY